jgi:hypothetical protein
MRGSLVSVSVANTVSVGNIDSVLDVSCVGDQLLSFGRPRKHRQQATAQQGTREQLERLASGQRTVGYPHCQFVEGIFLGYVSLVVVVMQAFGWHTAPPPPPHVKYPYHRIGGLRCPTSLHILEEAVAPSRLVRVDQSQTSVYASRRAQFPRRLPLGNLVNRGTQTH